MAIDFESVPGVEIPGGGPSNTFAPAVVVPIASAAASAPLVTRACVLLGYSFREATGLLGAVAELLDGGDDNGALIAALDVDRAVGALASETPLQATATGANAVVAATLVAPAGANIVVTTLRITGLGATAATEVDATLQGVLGGTVHYPISVPAGVAVPIAPVTDNFGVNGLLNSSPGTNIFLNVPAFGAGNTQVTAELTGYVTIPSVAADTQWFGPSGIVVRTGLRLRVVSGTVRGSAWVRLG